MKVVNQVLSDGDFVTTGKIEELQNEGLVWKDIHDGRGKSAYFFKKLLEEEDVL